MSGRRSRALKATMNRAERRRSIRRTATPPKVLAKLHKVVARLGRKRLNRQVARDKRRWSYRNRADAIRAVRAEAV